MSHPDTPSTGPPVGARPHALRGVAVLPSTLVIACQGGRMKSRRCLIVPLLLALLAGTARAQERTVTGTVTDSTTGSPLAGVQVALEPGGQRTQTRDNGSFALAGVPDQEVTLVFRLIGYRRGAVRLA